MSDPLLETNVLTHAVVALELLKEVIADPTAKAREKLKAIRSLKMGLFWLTRIADAQETHPNSRKMILEILQCHRQINPPPTKLTHTA